MLVLIIMSFCIVFIVVLGMMIGLLLSSWRRFFVSETMILEYFLVMAEGCQRQNWTVYRHMLRRVVLNF